MSKITLETERLCSQCKLTKSLAEFHKDSGRRRSICKKCSSEAVGRSILKRYGNYRNYNLIRNYGITEEDYDFLYEQQQGLCKLCERPRILVVDHSHKTGKVRALLCSGCNTGIGQFEHDPTLFDKAKEYVLNE